MDTQDRIRLKEKYRELSDEALIDMIKEGKDAYVEGGYELLLQEAKGRGIQKRLEEAEEKNRPKEPILTGRENGSEIFVQLVLIKDNADRAFLESIFNATDIPYYFKELGIRQMGLPAVLMVAASNIKEAVSLLSDFHPKTSIILVE